MKVTYGKVTSEAGSRYRGMLVYKTREGWLPATREAQLRRVVRSLHIECGIDITDFILPYIRGKHA